MTAVVKTKPCPFCGSSIPVVLTSDEYDGFRIVCRKCFALTDWCETEEKAVAAWNKRVPYEDDDWFVLPKPKETIVQYDSLQIEKTESGYKAKQPVGIIDSAIRAWGDVLGELIMKRICEVWSETCELVETNCYSNSNETIHVLECSECGNTCEHVNGSYPRCPHCGAKVQTK